MIARFTRDEASKYVWGLLTMAAIGGLVFAIVHSGTVLAEETKAAQVRATDYVENELEPRLDGLDPSVPLTGPRATALETALEDTVLSDTRVSRVRLWSKKGTLLFSTAPADDPGSDAGLNDQVLQHVSRDGVLTSSGISDTGGADDPERSLLRTYAPIQDEIVAEIDQTDAGTLATHRTAWRGYQVVAGVLIALFLVMTVLSLRDPIERLNVGVPFALSSIPTGYSLIDNERLEAVHEVYRLASERVAKLQRKLEASEEARRRLEGDIQRSLSKAATTPSRVDAPVASPPPPHVVPESVIEVPESEVVGTAASEPRTPALAGPLARASRDQKPPPEAPRKEKPVAAKPKRLPKRTKAKPMKERPAAREVVVTTPTAQPEQRVPAASSTQAPAPSQPVRTAASAPAPAARPAPPPIEHTAAPNSPAVALRPAAAPTPAPQPTPASVAPESRDDAKAHAAALETFIRLTESDRQHHDMSTIDQGAVRAALARTAARKKPGGDRLQPHGGPPEGSPEGPPARK